MTTLVNVPTPVVTPPLVFKEAPIPFHLREPVRVRSLGLVAKMLGMQLGVEVVFDPSITTAATDCRTKIFLPVLTDTATEEDADLLKGLVAHESAHCAETDPEVSKRCIKEKGSLANAIRNMYEDGRIERAQSLVYPGCPVMIDKALKVLVKRGVYQKPTDKSEPLDAVTGLLISGLRTKFLGQTSLESHFPLWRNKCAQLLGDKTTRALWRIAMKVKDAKSNEDSYTMAKETLDLIKDLAEGKEPEDEGDQGNQGDQQGQGSGQGQGQQQPGQQGQGQGSGQGEEDPNGQPQQGSGQGQGQQQPGQQQGKGKNQQQGSGNEPSMKDKQKAAQSILDATQKEIDEQKVDFAKAADEGLEQSGAKEQSGWGGGGAGSGRNDIGKRVDARAQCDQIIDRSRVISVRLGNELEALLEAKTDSDIYWTHSGRKVDSAKLSRVAVGNYRVFKHVDDREGLNTAFGIIVDISGSMDSWSGYGYGSSNRAEGSPLSVAEDAIWAILQAVDRFDGVVTYGAAFGTSIHPFKQFEETFRSARHYLWNRNADSGGTDTHYAVSVLGQEMMQRTEERRLAMVITDGMPSNVEATVAAIGELLRSGIEVAILFVAQSESVFAGLRTKLAKSGATFAMVNSRDHLVRGIFEAVKTAL